MVPSPHAWTRILASAWCRRGGAWPRPGNSSEPGYDLSPNVTVTVRYTLTARPFSVAGLYRHCRTARSAAASRSGLADLQDANVVHRAAGRDHRFEDDDPVQVRATGGLGIVRLRAAQSRTGARTSPPMTRGPSPGFRSGSDEGVSPVPFSTPFGSPGVTRFPGRGSPGLPSSRSSSIACCGSSAARWWAKSIDARDARASCRAHARRLPAEAAAPRAARRTSRGMTGSGGSPTLQTDAPTNAPITATWSPIASGSPAPFPRPFRSAARLEQCRVEHGGPSLCSGENPQRVPWFPASVWR